MRTSNCVVDFNLVVVSVLNPTEIAGFFLSIVNSLKWNVDVPCVGRIKGFFPGKKQKNPTVFPLCITTNLLFNASRNGKNAIG